MVNYGAVELKFTESLIIFLCLMISLESFDSCSRAGLTAGEREAEECFSRARWVLKWKFMIPSWSINISLLDLNNRREHSVSTLG
jgi:hypothetical protein